MNRLIEIGFQKAGEWKLEGGNLRYEPRMHGSQKNILYAFTSDGEVKYIGKTTRTLAKRMYGYQNPGESQRTNVKNHANIKELLAAGAAVEIFALPDNGLLHYGQFHVNLAAGLEDSIIAIVKPEWNGTPRKVASDDDDDDDGMATESMFVKDKFRISVQPTYHKRGFFNVPVTHTDLLAGDGEPIEIFCGVNSTPITGTIDRRSNQNKTPRVMGGVGLRDWLQENVDVMDEVDILVHSSNSIRITRVQRT